MILLNYKKFICFPLLLLVLGLNPSFGETLLTKSDILRKSNECFKDLQYELCSNLILEIEKIQLVMSEQNQYKCQSSILGLQTELVEATSFQKNKRSKDLIMIKYVIKNCKFLK